MTPLLAAEPFVHDINEVAIDFGGGFELRWYGLAYGFGAMIVFLILRYWRGKGRLPLTKNGVGDFVMVVFLCMFVGARLGYVLLYRVDALMADFTYLWRLQDGGMSSHGGIVGIIFGVWLYSFMAKKQFLVLMDGIAAATPLTIFFGRIANFINGELWGRPADPDQVPWAVIFPVDKGVPLINGENVPRHPSQLYAAGLEGLLVFAISVFVHARHRRPGVTLGTVLTSYATVRFINEFWREPDGGAAAYDLFFGWMSKGQLYSLPLLVAGIAIIVWSARRPSQPDAYTPPPPKEGEGGSAGEDAPATPKAGKKGGGKKKK